MHWIVVDPWSSVSQPHPAPSCLPNQAFQAPPTAAKGAVVRSAPAGMLTHTIDKAGWIIIPGSLPLTQQKNASLSEWPAPQQPVLCLIPQSRIQNVRRVACVGQSHRITLALHPPTGRAERPTSHVWCVLEPVQTLCCVCCGAVVRGTASNSTAQPGAS